MTDTARPDSTRPRTAVLMQHVGMGDLVWLVPYFRAVAADSLDGRVTLIAPPTTFARELVGHEPWMGEVIDFDRQPRRSEQRRGRHQGYFGLLRMAAQLRPHRFERVVLFSEHRWRTVMPFLLAGVRLRIGYGTQWLQRRLLTRTAWIQRYQGSAVAAYKDATAFCMTHGWCREPIVPRLSVREDAEAEMRNLLVELPRPCHALAIGASESYKQWGEACFGELANALCGKGHSVLLLGGPTEHSLATAILNRIEPRWRDRVLVMTENTVSQTVAALSLVQSCIGNDTGAANIAAAVGTPTWVVLGPRPPLEHDPITLHLLRAPRLQDIHPAEVAEQVLAALSE